MIIKILWSLDGDKNQNYFQMSDKVASLYNIFCPTSDIKGAVVLAARTTLPSNLEADRVPCTTSGPTSAATFRTPVLAAITPLAMLTPVSRVLPICWWSSYQIIWWMDNILPNNYLITQYGSYEINLGAKNAQESSEQSSSNTKNIWRRVSGDGGVALMKIIIDCLFRCSGPNIIINHYREVSVIIIIVVCWLVCDRKSGDDNQVGDQEQENWTLNKHNLEYHQ